MKLTTCEIFSFRLPLKYPLNIAGKKLLYRDGLLLKLENDKGDTGWGEVSPLPGLHSETIEECARGIGKTIDHWTEKVSALKNLGNLETLGDLSTHLSTKSARFGLESALLNLLVSHRQHRLGSLLKPNYAQSVQISGLLIDSGEEALQQVLRLYESGYRSIKIKVGRRQPEEEQNMLRRVTAETPPDLHFRLDANRAWTLDEALRFTRGLPTERIEYMEEPLKDPQELRRFCSESSISVALDETLAEAGCTEYLAIPNVSAAVLKPAVLGGIAATIRMAREAKKAGCTAVISDTFSSGVGLAVHLLLAAELGAESAAGLDTYRYLEKDILLKPLTVHRGQMHVAGSLSRAKKLNITMLKKYNLFNA